MISCLSQAVVASVLALAICTPVMATVLPWNIEGSFADGAPFAGAFDYDTATGAFSHISITTGAGSERFATEIMGWHYGDGTQVFGLQFHEVVPLGGDVVDLHDLFLANFDPGTPGPFDNLFLIETTLLRLNDPTKPSGIFQNRTGSGTASTRAIPEPAPFALMLAGLALMRGAARRVRLPAGVPGPSAH